MKGEGQRFGIKCDPSIPPRSLALRQLNPRLLTVPDVVVGTEGDLFAVWQ
jgi:hypothetical protein